MQTLRFVFSEYAPIVLTKRKPDGFPSGFIGVKNKQLLIAFQVFLAFPVLAAIPCETV